LIVFTQALVAFNTDNLINGFQDWPRRGFCCSSIAPKTVEPIRKFKLCNGNTPGNFRRRAEKKRAEFFVHSGE
jgi:hypothetical protein